MEKQWINIKEQSPSEDGRYFTANIYNSERHRYAVRHYSQEHGWYESLGLLKIPVEITHWMTIPKI